MSALIGVLYGMVAYVVFLLTFLYAIGFVGNLVVPKSIDSGAAGGLLESVMVNAALLTVFAVQHSVMARPGFKRWWTKIVPPVIERSTYVLFSSLALIALFIWWQPLPSLVWRVESEPLRWLLHGLYASGWLLLLVSTFLISHFELFGLRQVWLHVRGLPSPHTPFVIRSIYGLVRHPLMLGFLISFWATPDMSQGRLLFAVVTTAYIFVAVKFLEERDLVAAHGDAYRDYQRRVPMLLPLRKPAPCQTTRPEEITS
ncbi:MAG: methanethiol S-methyltransferase [Steroidobacter sp.]